MGRTVLYLARHGETDWNVAGKWQGHTDIPLNDNGRAQARALAELLRGVTLAGVVSSDLSRARETASIVAEHLGLGLPSVDVGLRERAFGPFEGLTSEECARIYPHEWRAWRQDLVAPEGAEDRPNVALRVLAAIARIAENFASETAPALVVTHGGAMRSAVAVATGMLPPPVPNGAVWTVEYEGRIVSARPLDSRR
jgi:broad specificity phosphatase PhoE